MKKALTKKSNYIVLLLVLLLAGCFALCACDQQGGEQVSSTQNFYDTVKESQEYLDRIGDAIYSCWYDAIYNDKYSGNINAAIAYARVSNSDAIDKVEENDSLIKDYFSDAKNASCGDKVKTVMSAYSDYYEFIINVSGSFSSYSKDKETKKKALASALRELSYEL